MKVAEMPFFWSDGGQLVAKTLAAAGGHNAKRVFAGDDRIDDGPLTRSKGGQPEIGEPLFSIGSCSGHRQWSPDRTAVEIVSEFEYIEYKGLDGCRELRRRLPNRSIVRA